MRREKRYVMVTYSIIIKQFNKNSPPKYKHDKRREKRYVVVTCSLLHHYNSMKTHLLKYRHDSRREKRYVVVTCSLTRKMKLTSYIVKDRRIERYVVVI